MLKPYARYADFKGRSSRKEYWLFSLFTAIAVVVLILVDGALFGTSEAGVPKTVLTGVFDLVTMIPALAVGVRRMHDINKSGWNILWSLLPIVGTIIYLIFLCRPGDKGPNRFGSNPLGGGAQQAHPAGGLSPDRYDQLEKLARLHKDGVLTKEEFEVQKATLLGAV